jgi:hypothetical protein
MIMEFYIWFILSIIYFILKFFCFFEGVVQGGEDRCVMSVWCILDADMVRVMVALGSVYVIQIGVEYFAIKVSDKSPNL